MRKYNEICKKLDNKEAQKLLEESYNDIVATRNVFVNKVIAGIEKMRKNYIFLKTVEDSMNPKNMVGDDKPNMAAAYLVTYMATRKAEAERVAANAAVDAFLSTLKHLKKRRLMTKAEVKEIKQIVLNEIKLMESDFVSTDKICPIEEYKE